jgi:hypothetical protein
MIGMGCEDQNSDQHKSTYDGKGNDDLFSLPPVKLRCCSLVAHVLYSSVVACSVHRMSIESSHRF